MITNDYYLEHDDSEEAILMRENLKRLLDSDDDQFVELAFSIIASGGFHKSFASNISVFAYRKLMEKLNINTVYDLTQLQSFITSPLPLLKMAMKYAMSSTEGGVFFRIDSEEDIAVLLSPDTWIEGFVERLKAVGACYFAFFAHRDIANYYKKEFKVLRFMQRLRCYLNFKRSFHKVGVTHNYEARLTVTILDDKHKPDGLSLDLF